MQNGAVITSAGLRATASTPLGKTHTRKSKNTNGQIAPGGNLDRKGTAKARILVVEDNSFVREGIVGLINGQEDLACCGEADSVASTPAAVAKCKPDLVLTDLRFKDGEAFQLMNSLALENCPPPILVLSQCDELIYAERSLQAGAKGYVMKVEAADELLNAIRTVLRGKVYLSPAMSARLVQRVLKPGLKVRERSDHMESR